TGTVWMRAPADSVSTVLSADPNARHMRMDGTITGAANVYVEGFHSYDFTGSAIDPVNDPDGRMAQIHQDAVDFLGSNLENATAIAQTLGGKNPRFALTVLPGVEIDSSGDLHVASTWDLTPAGCEGTFCSPAAFYSWHFGPDLTVPGALTIRAAGNLYVDQSITAGITTVSDPLASISIPLLGPMPGASWSYRLAAGADLNSANPLAVRNLTDSSLNPTSGSLFVAPGGLGDARGGVAPTPTVIGTGTG